MTETTKETFKEQILPWVRGADRYNQNLESTLEYVANEIVKIHEEQILEWKVMKLLPVTLLALFLLGACEEVIIEKVYEKGDSIPYPVYVDKPTFVTVSETKECESTDTTDIRVIIKDIFENGAIEKDTLIKVSTDCHMLIKIRGYVLVPKDSVLLPGDTVYLPVDSIPYPVPGPVQMKYDTVWETRYDRTVVHQDTAYLIGGMIRPTTSIPMELIPLLLEYGETSERYGKATPGAEMIIQYMPQSEMPGENWHSFSFDFSNQWVIYLDVNVPLEQMRSLMFRELMHLHHSKQYSNDPNKIMSPLFNPSRTITKTHLDELFQ